MEPINCPLSTGTPTHFPKLKHNPGPTCQMHQICGWIGIFSSGRFLLFIDIAVLGCRWCCGDVFETRVYAEYGKIGCLTERGRLLLLLQAKELEPMSTSTFQRRKNQTILVSAKRRFKLFGVGPKSLSSI